ncbi:HAMP domain-containing histidine kinase [Paenibacillus donghaensis]|uniref:sensor histidine kinase n=1 Tax=Paenibacillus donghaensis TaxID=414771 RepID=UPI001883BE8E|nr:HAMP domain-containing sensor histidine kinase [Paenibacillus donghaensis]MBE9917463.1 HAMP domain-containing histidine kinase [Paenibacillus donghaensis]
MNPMIKMTTRFIQVVLMLVVASIFCFILLAIGSFYLREAIEPLQLISTRTLMFTMGFIQIILFITVCGWCVGKPLIYLIRWINRLSKGNNHQPGDHYRTPSKNSLQEKKYRYPFALFKELFEEMSRLSEQLYHSETERLNMEVKKQEWISSISHDLKTPLSYIEGYARLLTAAEYHWTDEEKRDFSKQISDKTTEIKRLIQDLNHTSRWSVEQFPMNRKREDVVNFLRDAVIDIANHPLAEHTLFTFTTSKDVYMLDFDRKLLGRAIQNVLMNTVIHNPPGTEVACDFTIQDNSVLIAIEDNGVGIDEAVLKQGMNHSGKGIAIARAFIEAHSGHMNIMKVDGGGRGARIEITLPN